MKRRDFFKRVAGAVAGAAVVAVAPKATGERPERPEGEPYRHVEYGLGPLWGPDKNHN